MRHYRPAEDRGRAVLRLRLERQAMEDLKAYDKDLVLPEWEDLVRRCL